MKIGNHSKPFVYFVVASVLAIGGFVTFQKQCEAYIAEAGERIYMKFSTFFVERNILIPSPEQVYEDPKRNLGS